MFLIRMSKQTRKKLIRLGTARNAAKKPEWTRRASNVFNDRQVDILGCIGEYAASMALNVPMDWDVHVHGDTGADLSTSCGTVAVKYNHRSKGYLIVEERKPDTWYDLKADRILLVHGWCNPTKGMCTCAATINSEGITQVMVKGWLAKDKFKQLSTYVDWGLGGRFYVRADQLHPMELFYSSA